MSDQNHFDISLEGRVVVIRCHGRWTREIAVRLVSALSEFIERLEQGVPWATLVDFADWQPATADVADVANEIKTMVDEAGRTHGAFFLGSLEAAQLLIQKAVIDPNSKRIQHFQTENGARQWLDSLGYFDQSPRPSA